MYLRTYHPLFPKVWLSCQRMRTQNDSHQGWKQPISQELCAQLISPSSFRSFLVATWTYSDHRSHWPRFRHRHLLLYCIVLGHIFAFLVKSQNVSSSHHGTLFSERNQCSTPDNSPNVHVPKAGFSEFPGQGPNTSRLYPDWHCIEFPHLPKGLLSQKLCDSQELINNCC